MKIKITNTDVLIIDIAPKQGFTVEEIAEMLRVNNAWICHPLGEIYTVIYGNETVVIGTFDAKGVTAELDQDIELVMESPNGVHVR